MNFSLSFALLINETLVVLFHILWTLHLEAFYGQVNLPFVDLFFSIVSLYTFFIVTDHDIAIKIKLG